MDGKTHHNVLVIRSTRQRPGEPEVEAWGQGQGMYRVEVVKVTIVGFVFIGFRHPAVWINVLPAHGIKGKRWRVDIRIVGILTG